MQVDVGLCQIVKAGRPETVLVLAETVDSLVAIHHLMIQAMVDIAGEMVAHCPFELVVEANQGVGPQIEGSPYLESLSIAIKASDYHIQGICSKDHMHSLEEAWVVLVVQGVGLSVEGSEVLVEVPAVHLEGSSHLHLLGYAPSSSEKPSSEGMLSSLLGWLAPTRVCP
jgi:hypothetical protein